MIALLLKLFNYFEVMFLCILNTLSKCICLSKILYFKTSQLFINIISFQSQNHVIYCLSNKKNQNLQILTLKCQKHTIFKMHSCRNKQILKIFPINSQSNKLILFQYNLYKSLHQKKIPSKFQIVYLQQLIKQNSTIFIKTMIVFLFSLFIKQF
ncbi:unnamed protein product [Paramecium sonneborni]|uniref:Uncharacterized protein n=1 Tax=Paramecium sonneborni TaxID=65129 RepID=A0A8S1RR94_9CILI|nr:unnamed protein product [Paramecium sonneborni]